VNRPGSICARCLKSITPKLGGDHDTKSTCFDGWRAAPRAQDARRPTTAGAVSPADHGQLAAGRRRDQSGIFTSRSLGLLLASRSELREASKCTLSVAASASRVSTTASAASWASHAARRARRARLVGAPDGAGVEQSRLHAPPQDLQRPKIELGPHFSSRSDRSRIAAIRLRSYLNADIPRIGLLTAPRAPRHPERAWRRRRSPPTLGR
jgi:hypothetical protein